MRGFLQRIIDRRLRQLTVATTLGLGVVATAAVATGRVADPKLDDANIALERAQMLLRAAECGGAGEAATASCEQQVRKAAMLLVQARNALSAASTIVDGGDVDLPPAMSEKREAKSNKP